MIGALDEPTHRQAWQENASVDDMNNYNYESQGRQTKGKKVVKGALDELRNLQNTENSLRGRKKPGLMVGKENVSNVDSPLRMSELRHGENVEVYRMTEGRHSDGAFGLYPPFLKLQAERDGPVQFPKIPQSAWQSQGNMPFKSDATEMPLLRVDRTVPAHKFPVSHRDASLPRYKAEPGYFQPPSYATSPPVERPSESVDSGIGMPLLRLKYEDDVGRQPPRFGELLPPHVVIETRKEAEQKELLRERHLREFHELQVSLKAKGK